MSCALLCACLTFACQCEVEIFTPPIPPFPNLPLPLSACPFALIKVTLECCKFCKCNVSACSFHILCPAHSLSLSACAYAFAYAFAFALRVLPLPLPALKPHTHT